MLLRFQHIPSLRYRSGSFLIGAFSPAPSGKKPHQVPSVSLDLSVGARMKLKESVSQEGFLVLRNSFFPLANAGELAPHLRIDIAICDLFVNHQLSIKQIAQTLDEPNKRVVYAVIKQGIVQERRSAQRKGVN
jgi:hypothetical protein